MPKAECWDLESSSPLRVGALLVIAQGLCTVDLAFQLWHLC